MTAWLARAYGSRGNTHRRVIRWRGNGFWEKLLEKSIDEPDDEWLMIDAGHIKAHPHATGAKGDIQDAISIYSIVIRMSNVRELKVI